MVIVFLTGVNKFMRDTNFYVNVGFVNHLARLFRMPAR